MIQRKESVAPFRMAYVGLGSNLGDSRATLQSALDALRQRPGVDITSVSAIYRSVPMGPTDQPDYLNAVLECRTELEPEALLDVLQEIESDHGRDRDAERRWGPRTLDLDLLVMDGIECATRRLTLPHPGLTERDFVLVPLAEIAPDLGLPGGVSVRSLAERIPDRGLKRYA